MKKFDLICFDVDGTLVRHPSGQIIWEVLNSKFVGSDKVNIERKRMYSRGELTYDEWVELDVQGWIAAGATRAEVLTTVEEFGLVEGAIETIFELKARGYQLAVISGTLDVVIESFFPEHPFEDIFTNKLFFDDDGKLEGWEATPFDLHGKPSALKALARKHATTPERTAFVGDGENDLPLVGVAGFFVAFDPSSRELEEKANLVIKGESLHKLLDIFT